MLTEIAFHKEFAKIYVEIGAHAQYNPNVLKKIKDMYRVWTDQLTAELNNVAISNSEVRKISLTVLALFEGMSLMTTIFSKHDLIHNFDFKEFLEILSTGENSSR
jgi:hypothetical protein